MSEPKVSFKYNLQYDEKDLAIKWSEDLLFHLTSGEQRAVGHKFWDCWQCVAGQELLDVIERRSNP